MANFFLIGRWVLLAALASGCAPWDAARCTPCQSGGCPDGLECVDGACAAVGLRCGAGCGDGPPCPASQECHEGTCKVPIDVAVGRHHACALWASGHVSCWGDNRRGQATGSQVPQLAPRLIPEIDDAVQIDAQADATCVRHATGEVSCWGANDRGQLGDHLSPSREQGLFSRTPRATVLRSKAEWISSGSLFCASDDLGDLYCWAGGPTEEGPATCLLGDEDTEVTWIPRRVAKGAGFTTMTGGNHFALALDEAGGLFGWGWQNPWLETSTASSGTCRATAVPLPRGVRSVAAGYGHACAVTDHGEVWCRGSNQWNEAPATEDLATFGRYTDVRAAGGWACARTEGRQLVCWGVGAHGELGYFELDQPGGAPRLVRQTPDVAAYDLGEDGVGCLIGEDGVRCWGHVSFGALGGGDSSIAPPSKLAFEGATGLAAGVRHTCAIDAQARVHCWGDNAHGQLGRGSRTRAELPAVVVGLGRTVSLAAGEGHTCALDEAGAVWCWGDNRWGQVGGADARVLEPRRVVGLPAARAVVANWSRTCVIAAAEDALWCFGASMESVEPESWTVGRTPVMRAAAVRAVSLSFRFMCALLPEDRVRCWEGRDETVATPGAVELAAGDNFVCVRSQGGEVRCWGDNRDGQLGDGTADARVAPTPVIGLQDTLRLSTRFQHTCAVRSGGQVWCWGQDLYLGRLGAPPVSAQLWPRQVTKIPAAAEVATSRDGACIRSEQGEVWCWGYDDLGQILGQPRSQLIPELVRDLTPAVRVDPN